MEDMIPCACGCGRLIHRLDNNGRERKYISGHNDNWAGRHKWVICAVCGKQFTRKSKGQKLCSITCRTKVLQNKRPYQERQVEIQCFTCGRTFSRKASCVGSHNFCCQSCKNQWMGETYPQKISAPATIAKRRDDNKCRICGFDVLVEVHHIIPKRDGGEDAVDNLITLCPNHHTMADRKLITQDELRSYL